MADRELLVRIVGDDRDLQRALKNTERSTQNIDNRMQTLGRSVKGAFAAAGISLGAAAVFAGIEKSVSAASDLNEQISRTQVILGDSADEMIKWSTTTAQSMGISQRAALAASATFAGLFQTVGVSIKNSGELSRSLVQLAADLASLQNSSPEEALIALRSGLAGEAEPLRRFNIFLTEARVQQEAMSESGKRSASTLTAQEKTLARYNLILRDSVKSQGNFALTSGGLANQQRILKAQVDDLSTTLGSALVPALTAVVGALNDAAAAAGDLNSAIQTLADIPGIDIVVNFAFGGGRGNEIFKDWILGTISPAALGLKLGKEFADAFSDGVSTITFPSPDLSRPDNRPGTRGPGAITASNKAVAEEQARTVKRDIEASRRRFAESIKGLGLKLDRAGLTSTFQDDLAVIREIEGRIQRQIAIEGHTFALEQQLVNARTQEQAILEQIAAEGETKQTKSVENRAKKAAAEREKRKRIAEREAAARKAAQFEDLGLTSEGETRTPSSGALLRRAQSLQDQVKGTPLDDSKTSDQLKRIVNVLKRNFKTAGREVRQAILGMLNDIDDALNQGPKDQKGPLTKFRVQNFSNLAAQFTSLSQDDARKLQQILARTGPGATIPRSSTSGGAFGHEVGPGGVVFNGPVTIVAKDAEDLMQQLEKKGRRGAGSRTGPRVRAGRM